MSEQNKRRKTVAELFHLFELGEWDKSAELFTSQAKIIGQYGQKISAVSINEFIEKMKNGPLSKLGKPIYLDRRVIIKDQNHFIEQHISQLTIGQETLKIPACIVGKFDESGLISQLEEYLDPTPIINALFKLKG